MRPFLQVLTATFLSTGVLLALSMWLARKWVASRIEYAIKYDYDQQLEKLKDSLACRTRAALIGELLAEWLSRPDDRKVRNRLTFEAFLWLPEQIAHDLSKLLACKPDAPSTRDLLIRVRSHLLGVPDGLESQEVIVFPPRAEAEENPGR